ncbi:MAG: sulfotransferase family protein [Actinomycetota bacterium]
MTVRVQCWSGPRNISTAFMYSWAQRADTTVVDEPLYAAYLARFDRGHPMTAEVLASQSQDPAAVIEDVILGPVGTPVLFCKQMAHHLRDLDTAFLGETENLLLTRHPVDMLRSLSAQLPHCDLDDTGLPEQVQLVDDVIAAGGRPIVVDSQVLLDDPRGMLAALCERLGLSFDEAMLSWSPGPKPYDGVWAAVWYANVHRSTGFGPPRTPNREPLPEHLGPVLAAAEPLYERLAAHAVSAP